MLACREGAFKAQSMLRTSPLARFAAEHLLCKLCSSSPRPKEPSALCAAFTEMPSGCGDKACVRIACVSRTIV